MHLITETTQLGRKTVKTDFLVAMLLAEEVMSISGSNKKADCCMTPSVTKPHFPVADSVLQSHVQNSRKLVEEMLENGATILVDMSGQRERLKVCSSIG